MSAELSKVRKSIRTIGGLNIAMGVVSIVTGLVVGVGCIVSGGRQLNKSGRRHRTFRLGLASPYSSL